MNMSKMKVAINIRNICTDIFIVDVVKLWAVVSSALAVTAWHSTSILITLDNQKY
jgi:hypothetical protein